VSDIAYIFIGTDEVAKPFGLQILLFGILVIGADAGNLLGFFE